MATFTSWKYKDHFILISNEWDLGNPAEKNIRVKCKLCNSNEKTFSTSKSSTSNLMKHLLKAHPAFKLKIKDEEEPLSKQSKFVEFYKEEKCDIKELLATYFIDELQPVSVVESPAFKQLIQGVSGKPIALPCRRTMTNFIDAKFNIKNEILKGKFTHLEYVCTTADIWTAQNKSFFGMTAHWICPRTLARKKAALCCTRFYGNHTFDAIAEVLTNVHNDFQLTSKTVATITDNSSNFMKAFRIFQECENEDIDNDDCDEIVEAEFVNINDILCNTEDWNSYFLLPHRRCAAHTINLVCKDMEKFIKSSPQAHIFQSAMKKCAALWLKFKRSPVVGEIIENATNMKLVIPIETRWNSQLNGLKQIIQIESEVLLKIFVHINLQPLTTSEITLLQQYIVIAQPLAKALDVLQDEDNCYYGTLIPVLYTLKRKLEKLTTMNMIPGLNDNVIKTINRRFFDVLLDKNAKLAAVSNPHFKNMYTENFEEKQLLRTMLLEEMKKMSVRKSEDIECNSKSNTNSQSFFDFVDEGLESVEVELNNYFRYCKNIKDLMEYATIKTIFLKYNTCLPSCASVERLFSLDGQILTPKCKKLTDKHFEKLLMLRYNKDF